MICFKDRAFCSSDCVNTSCFRHFGEDDRAEAKEWWKGMRDNPPIAWSDFSAGCPWYKKP